MSAAVAAILEGMPEPRDLRMHEHDGRCVITAGRVVLFEYAAGDVVMRNIALAALRQLGFKGRVVAAVLGLMTVSMVVLIYFIHHIASSIQLPRVIASIAGRPFAGDRCRVDGDRCRCHRVRAVRSRADDPPGQKRRDRPRAVERLPPVHPDRHETLIRLAAEKGAVIRLLHRPGQFAVRGHPMATDWHPIYAHRDEHGYVRVITAHVSYESLVERAFEKIRQAGRGMPAVSIRQLEALRRIMEDTTLPAQRELSARASGDDPSGIRGIGTGAVRPRRRRT